jgi:hypothetical protein
MSAQGQCGTRATIPYVRKIVLKSARLRNPGAVDSPRVQF